MMPSQFNNILLAKLQTLLGERGAKQESAVRFRDLADVYDTAATRSTVIVLQKIEPISQAVTENAATIASNQTAAQVVENALAQTQADLVQAVADIDANAAELVSAQLQLNTFQASAEADINAAQSEIITAQANIAQVQENIAAAEASIAAAEASIASTEASIVTLKDIARGGLNGWLKDPIFAEWTGSNLTAANWAGTTGVTAYGSKFSGLYGSGLAINVPSGSASITISASNTSGLVNADPDAPWLVLSFAVEFVSGEPLGLRLRAEWSNDGVTWTRGAMLGATNPLGTLVEHGVTVKAGVVQVKEVLVKRPAGTFAYVRVLFIPKVNSTSTAQVQNWHVLNLRAATEAEIRAGNVPTMQSDITTIQATATTLAGSVATLSTTLSSTTTTANNAASAAGAAQTSADNVAANLSTNYLTATQTDSAIASAKTELNATISTNANTAASAAQAASDLAGGKGKVLYQSTAPVTADRLAQNLWIDTTGGANTPKRWNGSAWVAVTDKIATDAAAAAAAAQSTANTVSADLSTNYLTTTQTNSAIASAKTELNATISNNAVTAANAAQAASDLAGGKGKVLYQSTAPATVDRLAQNLWIDTTGSANTPKRWNGTTWVAVTDKIATDAAAAAAAAQSTANTVTANLSTNYLTATQTNSAIASAKTELNATINTNATTAANAAQAASDLAGGKGKVLYQTSAPAVADRLAQNLWIDTTGGANTPKRWNGSAWVAVTDKIATDAASAAAAAQSTANTVTANLSTNYLTATQTNSAIASAKTELSATIDSLADTAKAYKALLTSPAAVVAGSAVSVVQDGSAMGLSGTIRVAEGATARVSSGLTNGAYVTVPTPLAVNFAGQRIKIGVLAKAPASNAATRFTLAYSTNADGNSGYLYSDSDLTTSWKWYSFFYDVPAASNSNTTPSYVGLFADNSKTGKETIFGMIVIDLAAVADDLPEIGAISANLSTNYLTAVDTNAAIASLDTTLSSTISANATSAANAAQAASDLAGSKGKVFFQTSAPAVADRLAQNLWIDTTGGANTPKRWNGSAWVAVTDKIATDAAAAAAAAQSTANTVSANLSTNYLTATQTNTAIASAKTELNATIAGNATTAAAATSAEAITRANEDSAISAYLLNVESAFSTANGVLASQFLDTIIPRWNSGGSMTSTANEVHKIGLTRTFVTTDVQSDGLNLNSTQSTIWLGEKYAAAYVVEVDFTLVSGTLDGSGFLTRWVNTTPTTYGVASKLSDCLTSPLVLGQVMKARALIKKPTGFTGTFSKNEAFLMANWSGFGVPATAKTIKFHRWLVRPATAEEIATGVIQSDLATLSANVSNNIYTKSATDAAIASQTNIVQANVDSLAASVQGYQVPLTAVNKVTAGAAVTVTLDAAALGQTGTIKVVEGSTARVTTGATNGASILVPARTALLFAGQRVKISILAKKPSSGGASNFSIAYASADGNSGVLAMEAGTSLSTTWAWFSFYYTVPAVAAGGDSYIGLFGDNSKTSKATIFARAMIDVAAVSGDLPEIATLTASSTAYSAAIAQLNGNAAATQSFRVVAGSAGASVELVASDNPVSGPASSAIISGKHIELKASSVRISNASNIYLDYDLIDDDFYSSPDSAVLTFLPTTSAALGKRYMNIAANAAIKTINSGWVPVEYGATYKVSAAGWIASAAAGAGTVKVFLELGDVNTSGAATATSRILICSTTDLNFSLALFGSIEFATSGITRAVRFVVERQAGGTASARAGAFKIEKKSDSTLIVDGAIYANHLGAGSVTADKMDVAWLNAGRLSASYLDVDGLLTIGVGAGMKYQKSSVSDDATDGVYLGVESASGSPRFGFAASRTSPLGKKQSLKLTSNEGLQLVNARHFVTGSSAATPAFAGSSQTITLPVGSKYLNLEIYGGGGGGKGGADTTATYANGGNGGTTLVKLFNGTTDTGISWSGAGGAGGSLTTSSDSGQYGQASPFGSGGIGYRRASGGNASGNAAGGAGGGDYYASGYGGAAAVPNTQNLIDISGYANPKLVITVGAGGAGGPNGGGGGTGAIGGNGSPGCVNYSVSLQSLTPADVIPLTATASGVIYKTGLSITFPDLGAGLWFLSSEDGTSNLDIGWIAIGGADGRHILQDKSAVFVSAFTPYRDGGGFSANRTIRYHFYSMGNWG
jgi:hypothetical protein